MQPFLRLPPLLRIIAALLAMGVFAPATEHAASAHAVKVLRAVLREI